MRGSQEEGAQYFPQKSDSDEIEANEDTTEDSPRKKKSIDGEDQNKQLIPKVYSEKIDFAKIKSLFSTPTILIIYCQGM